MAAGGDRSLVRRRPVAALLAAELVSLTGSQMTWIALPWFVLTTTGSATRTALVVAVEVIALGLCTLPAGRLLRRLGAQRTMLVSDGARAPLLALVPLLYWADALSFGLLLVLVGAIGALSAPYFAAQKVVVPEVLGEDELLVTRASTLFQSANRATFLLGPVVGGVLISVTSAPAVLLVDAASYVVAFALVALFVPARRAAVAEADLGVRAGVRYLLREPLLRVWTAAIAVGDTAWVAFFITVPVLVVERFEADPRVAGWLIASFGLGALLGNGLAYRFLAGVNGLTVVAVFGIGQALPLWLLVPELPAAVYSGALFLSGVANGLHNPSLHALLTLRIPPALRPTVLSAMAMVFVLTQPLGLFGAGPALDEAGPSAVLLAFAAVQTCTTALVSLAALRARGRPAAALAP